jgi:F-type H+-transporting ATPase subunit delta
VKQDSGVAKSYAKALFDLAKERGQTDQIGADLQRVVEVAAGDGELADFLSRPWIAASTKRATAAEVAGRLDISPLARDFMALVAAHGRADHLEAIALAYRDLVDADQNRVRARVRSTVALTPQERDALSARLSRALGGKQVVLSEEVDPALLGGFIAEVGSLVLDGSLDGQLARIRQRLAAG